jgi:hypothetical protein
MKEKGAVMHQNSSIAIKKALDQILQDLPAQISHLQHKIIEQMKYVIETAVEENSTNSKYRKRTTKSQSKINLQNSLQEDISKLVQAWKEKICFEPEVRQDISDWEFEKDDKYHIREVDDDDEDYIDEGFDLNDGDFKQDKYETHKPEVRQDISDCEFEQANDDGEDCVDETAKDEGDSTAVESSEEEW